MKIGLFDHVEDGERPLAQLYDERLEFAVAAEDAGFYCLHVAEHHATPLNLAPVPGVYLGAVARLTKRLRFGPLVYLLPLYSPLRLIEEICMLDHLSHGRFDIGVGRGVSPYELEFHNVMHDDSRDIFFEAYDCIKTGLTSETFSYKSARYLYNDVPIALKPLQQPHPPFWYASSSDVGSVWAGEHGLHYVTLGSNAMAKANIATFKAALAKRGSVAQPKPEFSGGVVIGLQRHICVADTDEEAHRIFKPAMEVHLKNLNWLRVWKNDTGLASRLKIPHGGSYEEMVAHGGIVVGSAATVHAELERQARDIGFNYLLTYLFLGTMSLKEAMRSLELFRTEVMPHLEKL